MLAAEAIIQAITSENPPLHLLLGAVAYQRAAAKIESLQKDFETWREVALETDFKSGAIAAPRRYLNGLLPNWT